MKKILALALAVVMLVSMATTAMAAPTSGEGVIRFVVDGIQHLPPAGPFCPVTNGPNITTDADGNRTGGWTGDFDFLNNFGSTNLEFGSHPFPPMGMPLNFAVTGNTNLAGRHVSRDRGVIGMGMQGLIVDGDAYPNIVMLDGRTWRIDLTLFEFQTSPGGPRTLDGFQLDLTVAAPPRNPQSFPGGITYGPAADWNVSNVQGLTQTNINTPEQQWDTQQIVANGRAIGVFGWEWNAVLRGTHQAAPGSPTGTNIQPGTTPTATLLWQYTSLLYDL